ncbi:MAG: HAD family hydrolase [Bacteroidales bacterium]|nr:HAD family hydrolase [Candidatus Equibacterium intestinale]
MKKLILFDLDGTLLNTLGGIGSACNEMLAKYNFPTWDIPEYVNFVGSGGRALIKDSLPLIMSKNESFVDEAREVYLGFYRANLARLTSPYEGIPELLAELQRRGVLIALTTNKFHDGAEYLMHHFFPEIRFAAIQGHIPGFAVKPDPQIPEAAIATNRKSLPDGETISKDEMLYIGDSDIDMQTASNLGVESVGVTWGFRSREILKKNGACHIVDKPSNILDLI